LATSPQTGVAASGCKPLVDGALAWFEKSTPTAACMAADRQQGAGRPVRHRRLANARQLAGEGILVLWRMRQNRPPCSKWRSRTTFPTFANAGVVHVTGDANYRVIQPLWSISSMASPSGR
jgi:hypothetical protein